MSMFKKGQREGTVIADELETIIGPSVKIEGHFQSSGNVVVAGVISGKLITTQSLKIEESAKITADIEAQDAIIAGGVSGNITIAGHLEILSSARISGDIKTGSIAIQQGAVINGNCAMASSIKEEEHKETDAHTTTPEDRAKTTAEWLEAESS